MKRAVFLLSKSPYGRRQDGETQVSRVLLEAAAQSCEVSALALADEPGKPGPVNVTEIEKPPMNAGALLSTALGSLRRRRSAIHTRFSPPELVRAIAGAEADLLVARRLYMAQAALDAGRSGPGSGLVAIADVLESAVMRRRRGAAAPLLALEARRTWRDEVRCASAAEKVACLSETEVEALSGELARTPTRLDLVLPPANQAGLEDPAALFIGDLRWAPNREAAREAEQIWPAIRTAAPDARLLMVGRGTEKGRGREGIERLGFVEDIDAIWDSCALLLAPVPVGGGVRVKILDSVRRGVPVVGSEEAVGSAGDYLPLSGHDSRETLVSAAAELLGDAGERRRAGSKLFEANRALASEGFVERQVAELLSGPATPPT